MFRRTSTFLFLTITACTGRTIELDVAEGGQTANDTTTAKVPSADAGFTVVKAEEGETITAIAVDAERLYWSTFTDQMGSSSLKSCLKESCGTSVINYPVWDMEYPGDLREFRVRSGEIYWLTNTHLAFCPVAGCQHASQQIFGAKVFEMDDREIYLPFDDGDMGYVTVIPRTGNMQVWGLLEIGRDRLGIVNDFDSELYARRIDTSSPPGLSIGNESLAWISRAGALVAMRKDGTEPPRRLTDTPVTFTFAVPRTAQDENHVYWAISSLAGFIQRCPLSGCPAGPESVAQNQARPRLLTVAQQDLIFERNAAGSVSGLLEIVSCDKADCRVQTHLGTVATMATSAPLAADETHVYAVTTDAVDATATDNSLAKMRIVSFVR